jgi:hypothetical protein
VVAEMEGIQVVMDSGMGWEVYALGIVCVGVGLLWKICRRQLRYRWEKEVSQVNLLFLGVVVL